LIMFATLFLALTFLDVCLGDNVASLDEKLKTCNVSSLEGLECREIFQLFSGYGSGVDQALHCFGYNKFLEPFVR